MQIREWIGRTRTVAATFVLLSTATVAGAESREALRQQAKALFGVIPAEAPNAADPASDAKVELGRLL